MFDGAGWSGSDGAGLGPGRKPGPTEPIKAFLSSSSILRMAQIDSQPSICPDYLSIPTWDYYDMPPPVNPDSSSSSKSISRFCADN